MNIVVCVKQVVDIQQVRIRHDTREPVLDNIPLTIGNIDKNALEEGVRLRDTYGGKVTVLSVGSQELEETIKEGLAMGADEALLVIDQQLNGAESSVVAEALARAIRRVAEFDLVILGEGSADNYSGQVGPRLAELLELPLITFVKSLEVDGKRARLIRNLEDCLETVEVELPAVITVMSEINEPRIPTVSQILRAGKKPREIVTPEELGMNVAEIQQKIRVLSNLAPEQERKQIVFKGSSEETALELFKALQSEGLIRG